MTGSPPSWGTPAFVNIDDGFATDPNADVTYYSDRETWLLPIGLFNVNEKIVSLWWNTTFDEPAYTAMTQKLQARYITPADPVALGEKVDIYSEGVGLVSQFNPFAPPAGAVQKRGALGMWDQNTWGSAVIGDQLYLQFGTYTFQYDPDADFLDDPVFAAAHAVWLRIDCSGDAPAWAVSRFEGAIFTDTPHSPLNRCITFNLAAVGGRLLSIPQYDDTATHANCPIIEHDLDTLASLWESDSGDGLETTAHFAESGKRETQFVAHSDTETTWLVGWDSQFHPLTLNPGSVTIGAGEDISDPYLEQFDGFYPFVGVATVNLMPTAAMRGPSTHANGMMLSDLGDMTWHVWYEDGAFGIESWPMVKFNEASPNGIDPSSPAYGGGSGFGYGWGYDNGPSFAYAMRVPGNELQFLPLYDRFVSSSNSIYIDVGIDTDPEESLATFKHADWGVVASWAPHIVAAQLADGSGILMEASNADTDQPYGKYMAIPFFLNVKYGWGVLIA